MAIRRVKFTFPQDLIKEPVIYEVGRKFKIVTNIRRAELQAVVDEAHRRGMKVTGHLCSISFSEAVEIGIDNLEHGLVTNTDYYPGKEPDQCPTGNNLVAGRVDVRGPEV